LKTPILGPLVVATVAEKTADNMTSYTWWRHAIHISSRCKAFSISVHAPRCSPVFELVVSNTSPRTLERSCHSSRAQRQALHCCCPVPLPIFGTASSCSKCPLVTKIATRSTTSLLPDILGSNFPSQWRSTGLSTVNVACIAEATTERVS